MPEIKDNIPSVLVLVAALNEEEGIGLALAELKRWLSEFQLLVVDGNSRDRTVHIAKSLGAEVICQRGKGKGDAIGHAFKHLGKRDYDYVVLIDGDYTYPADYIPQMIRILEENLLVGMVCGNRFSYDITSSVMKKFFWIGNRFLAWTQRFLNGVHLDDPLTGLRVIRWGILENWEPKSNGFDIEAEMNHLVERKGYQILEIPIRYRRRVGEKKLKLKDGLIILRRIMMESAHSHRN